FQEAHLFPERRIEFFNNPFVSVKLIELFLHKWECELPSKRSGITAVTTISDTDKRSSLRYATVFLLIVGVIPYSLTVEVRHVIIVDECVRCYYDVGPVTKFLARGTVRLYAEYIALKRALCNLLNFIEHLV